VLLRDLSPRTPLVRPVRHHEQKLVLFSGYPFLFECCFPREISPPPHDSRLFSLDFRHISRDLFWPTFSLLRRLFGRSTRLSQTPLCILIANEVPRPQEGLRRVSHFHGSLSITQKFRGAALAAYPVTFTSRLPRLILGFSSRWWLSSCPFGLNRLPSFPSAIGFFLSWFGTSPPRPLLQEYQVRSPAALKTPPFSPL